MKKTLTILSAVFLVAFGIYLIVNSVNKGQTTSNNDQNSMILFYGESCPHCKKVEEYIKTNQIESKIQIEQKEVYNNKENQELLVEKAKFCKLETDSIGVPFLWTGSECLMGDQPIINYFNQKVSEK